MADKVLIVDDEEGIRRVLRISLSEAGYYVLTAGNGAAALQLLREENPSIVLADIKMPGMGGIELLQMIKEESPDTEVIMMTGHADLELAVQSLQFEASDFITKPVNYNALEVALKRVQEKIWMRSQIRKYTTDLEKLVSEKTRQLIEAERLAAIGQTVAVLAHAVKNIISGLQGGMFVVEKGLELSNKKYLHQGWEMVKGNVDKVKNLAMDLLSYSKTRDPDYDFCDPNIPAREVYHLMLLRAKEHDVDLKLDLTDKIPNAYLDPEGIYTCLLNLVTNAVDACALNARRRKPRGEVLIRSQKTDGWAVEYQVVDNGCGLDEEQKEKVFHSFFSTKGSKGTGLGLMITEKIVREHGGVIHLRSAPGEGARFTIRLPEKEIQVDRFRSKKDEDDE